MPALAHGRWGEGPPSPLLQLDERAHLEEERHMLVLMAHYAESGEEWFVRRHGRDLPPFIGPLTYWSCSWLEACRNRHTCILMILGTQEHNSAMHWMVQRNPPSVRSFLSDDWVQIKNVKYA